MKVFSRQRSSLISVLFWLSALICKNPFSSKSTAMMAEAQFDIDLLSEEDKQKVRDNAKETAIQYFDFAKRIADVWAALATYHEIYFDRLKDTVMEGDFDRLDNELETLLNDMTVDEQEEMSEAALELKEGGAGSLLLVFSASLGNGFIAGVDIGVAINLNYLLFPIAEARYIDYEAPIATIFTAKGAGLGFNWGAAFDLDFLVGYHIADPAGVGGYGIDVSAEANVFGVGYNVALAFDALSVDYTNFDFLPDLLAFLMMPVAPSASVSADAFIGGSEAAVEAQFCPEGFLRDKSHDLFPFFRPDSHGVDQPCSTSESEEYWTKWNDRIGGSWTQFQYWFPLNPRTILRKVYVIQTQSEQQDCREGWERLCNNAQGVGHVKLAENCGGKLASADSHHALNLIQALVDEWATGNPEEGLNRFWLGARMRPERAHNWYWYDSADWSADSWIGTYGGLSYWSNNQLKEQAIRPDLRFLGAYLNCTNGCSFDEAKWYSIYKNQVKGKAIYQLPMDFADYPECDTSTLFVSAANTDETAIMSLTGDKAFGASCQFDAECASDICNLNVGRCDDVMTGRQGALCMEDSHCSEQNTFFTFEPFYNKCIAFGGRNALAVKCGTESCITSRTSGIAYEERANCVDWTEIRRNGFETGYGFWNDGGTDSSRVQSNAKSGQYSVRLRDNSGSSNIESDNLDVSSAFWLKVCFSFITDGMDTDEYFQLKYKRDGGNWLVAHTFKRRNGSSSSKRTTHFNNGSRQEPCIYVKVDSADTARLKIENEGSSDGDKIYLDEIQILSA